MCAAGALRSSVVTGAADGNGVLGVHTNASDEERKVGEKEWNGDTRHDEIGKHIFTDGSATETLRNALLSANNLQSTGDRYMHKREAPDNFGARDVKRGKLLSDADNTDVHRGENLRNGSSKEDAAVLALDPLSVDFPTLEGSQSGEGRVPDGAALLEGVPRGSQATVPVGEDVLDPFTMGDDEFSFPDLDVVEASADDILQDDPSLEIVSEALSLEKVQTQTNIEEKDANVPDFSVALSQMEDQGLYEDDAIDLSSDDEEANPTLEITHERMVTYPMGARSTLSSTPSTIDLTGDVPLHITAIPRDAYGQPVSYGYVPETSYDLPFGSYTSSLSNPDRPLSKDSLEDLMKKNNLTADATEEEPTPPQLEVELMAHQKRALKWMRKRELMDPSVRGGILADDQGLGKTLSAIALIVSNQPKPIPLDHDGYAPDDYESHSYDIPADTSSISEEEDDDSSFGSYQRKECEDRKTSDHPDLKRTMRAPWRTLIVCPVSLVHQWKDELIKRIRAEDEPSIYIYHGKTKTQDIEELQGYDVVITTYSTLAMQYPKVDKKDPNYAACKEAKAPLPTRPPGAMYKMRWFRVILDEAQYIKNRYTENFQAVYQLKAYRRWCLTGTPIQNSVDDLYSQFCFIRYMIVLNYKEWQRVWKKKLESPYAMTRERAFQRFQAVVGVVLLRRTKLDKIDNKPLITLPERTVELKELDFKDPDEASFYQSVQVTSILAVNKYLTNGTLTNNYSSILLLLLRLRQAATHPHLMMSLQRSYDLSSALHDPTKQPMLEHLKQRFGAPVVRVFTCGVPPVCLECQSNAESWNSVVTRCGHVLCSECIPDPLITCPECQMVVDQFKFTLEQAYAEMKRFLGPLQNQTARTKAESAESIGVKQEGQPQNSVKQEEQGQAGSGSGEAKGIKRESLPVQTGGSDGKPEHDEIKLENTIRSPDCSTASPDTCEDMKSAESHEVKRENSPTDPAVQPSVLEKSGIEKGRSGSMSSTKLDTLVHELALIKQSNPVAKSLVFSQWTSMLDIVERTLKGRGFMTCRLDGSMAMSARRDQIERFNTCTRHTIMLISLHAGGTGLNLTVAQNVFLMDVWWNPAVEEQAIDRAHRIGQRRSVRVVRMKMRGTVEERIYDLCAKKRELMDGALGVKGSQSLGRKKLSMKELMYLFGGAAEDVLNTRNVSSVGGMSAGQPSEAAEAAANILAFAKDGI